MSDYSQTLALFAVFLFGIMIVPGSDMLYVLGSTLAGGVRRGSWALSGVVAGGAIHSLVAALGLSALIAAFPGALKVILVAGGTYIAYLGLGLMRPTPSLAPSGGPDVERSDRRAALSGMMTCLLNPKAYLFMLAILPGFIRPEFGPWWRQFVIIGAMICAMQAMVYGSIMMAGKVLATTLVDRPVMLVRLQQIMGFVLLGFALWAVIKGLSSQRPAA